MSSVSPRPGTCSQKAGLSPSGTGLLCLATGRTVGTPSVRSAIRRADTVLQLPRPHLPRPPTAITRTALAATADGIRYSMSGASPPFARLWPRYWPDGDAPSIHRTTAAAVLSAVVLQADLWNFVPTT